MGSLFGQFAVFENDDIIETEGREYPMSNDNGSFVVQVPIQVSNDLMFCFCINGTKTVVENNDLGFFDQCTGYGDPLFLSATKRYTPLSYHCFIPVAEPFDFFVNA